MSPVPLAQSQWLPAQAHPHIDNYGICSLHHLRLLQRMGIVFYTDFRIGLPSQQDAPAPSNAQSLREPG